MKWVTLGYKRKLKRIERRDWHRWFAWRPVTVKEMAADPIKVPRMRIWWEYVERRGNLLPYCVDSETGKHRPWNERHRGSSEVRRGSLFWEYRPIDVETRQE